MNNYDNDFGTDEQNERVDDGLFYENSSLGINNIENEDLEGAFPSDDFPTNRITLPGDLFDDDPLDPFANDIEDENGNSLQPAEVQNLDFSAPESFPLHEGPVSLSHTDTDHAEEEPFEDKTQVASDPVPERQRQANTVVNENGPIDAADARSGGDGSQYATLAGDLVNPIGLEEFHVNMPVAPPLEVQPVGADYPGLDTPSTQFTLTKGHDVPTSSTTSRHLPIANVPRNEILQGSSQSADAANVQRIQSVFRTVSGGILQGEGVPLTTGGLTRTEVDNTARIVDGIGVQGTRDLPDAFYTGHPAVGQRGLPPQVLPPATLNIPYTNPLATAENVFPQQDFISGIPGLEEPLSLTAPPVESPVLNPGVQNTRIDSAHALPASLSEDLVHLRDAHLARMLPSMLKNERRPKMTGSDRKELKAVSCMENRDNVKAILGMVSQRAVHQIGNTNYVILMLETHTLPTGAVQAQGMGQSENRMRAIANDFGPLGPGAVDGIRSITPSVAAQDVYPRAIDSTGNTRGNVATQGAASNSNSTSNSVGTPKKANPNKQGRPLGSRKTTVSQRSTEVGKSPARKGRANGKNRYERAEIGDECCGLAVSEYLNLGGERFPIRSLAESEKLSCTLCSSTFGSSSALEEHQRNQHSGTQEREHVCRFCQVSFKSPENMTRHVATSHPEGASVKCDSCAAMFSDERQMNLHKSKVHGNRQRRDILQRKVWECMFVVGDDDHKEICGYSSSTKTNVSRHIKSQHANFKPWGCAICKARCTTKQNAETHLRKNHPNEPLDLNVVFYEHTQQNG